MKCDSLKIGRACSVSAGCTVQHALIGNGLGLQSQLTLIRLQGVVHGVDLRDDGALALLAALSKDQ